MKGCRRRPARERLSVLVDDCPCTQTRCHRHGNCVECIRVHRTRQQHIPECLQEMFRSRIAGLAALVEYNVLDLRRTPAYWDERLGKENPTPSKHKGITQKRRSEAKRKQPPGRRKPVGIQ